MDDSQVSEAMAGAQLASQYLQGLGQNKASSTVAEEATKQCESCVRRHFSGGQNDRQTAIDQLDLLKQVLPQDLQNQVNGVINGILNAGAPVADPAKFVKEAMAAARSAPPAPRQWDGIY